MSKDIASNELIVLQCVGVTFANLTHRSRVIDEYELQEIQYFRVEQD
jgi:hypothetical protein